MKWLSDERWNPQDEMEIHYLFVQPGKYTLPDGTQVDGGGQRLGQKYKADPAFGKPGSPLWGLDSILTKINKYGTFTEQQVNDTIDRLGLEPFWYQSQIQTSPTTFEGCFKAYFTQPGFDAIVKDLCPMSDGFTRQQAYFDKARQRKIAALRAKLEAAERELLGE